MEICRRPGLLWFFTGILLLLNCSANAGKEDKPDITYFNLSPYIRWYNVYRCMNNHSGTCEKKNELNISGIVDVGQNEIPAYCRPEGCGDHIKDVLNCLHVVKSELKFVNGATVELLQDNITHGCRYSKAFSTAHYNNTSSATRMTVTIITALFALPLMTVFNF